LCSNFSGEIQNPLNLFNPRAGFKTRSKGKTLMKSNSNHAHNLKQDRQAKSWEFNENS
jgi:hypothetical protein